jgi:hypothetical protein
MDIVTGTGSQTIFCSATTESQQGTCNISVLLPNEQKLDIFGSCTSATPKVATHTGKKKPSSGLKKCRIRPGQLLDRLVRLRHKTSLYSS